MSAFNPPETPYEPYPAIPRQPRKEPMKVLCLGLSRTGTMSTWTALNKLGFPSYHMLECNLNKLHGNSFHLWRSAIEAKYHNGKGRKLVTADDFDELLWRYQAVSDIPTILFADELIAAYPDAKVILTERDVEGWMKSMENSFYKILSWKIWWFLELTDWQHTRQYLPLLRYPIDIWTKGDPENRDKLRQGFHEYNAHIKSVVPKERLLVFHPRDGWEPFCKHLGVPIPNEPFPKVNEGDFVADLHSNMIVKWRIMMVLTGFAKKSAPVVVAGLAVWACWLMLKKW
ncbi:hypothetical protein LTR17_001961 [Elasticomyces elasticus]|nr:hypothetical protein LTR17_001961 [Elasticomyces elasticus]